MKTLIKNLSVILCAVVCFKFSIAHAATTNVEISGFAFVASTVAIAVGDTVTWTERDGAFHTTTSDTGLWNSGALPFNGTFSFTFTNAGNFPYHCIPHPQMLGLVIVEQAGNTPPSVTITNPLNNGTFTAGTSLTIAAQASDSDGSVTNVEFFDGATSLGSDSSPPFSISPTLYAGVHLLTAVATDNDGETATSAIVTNTGVSTAITNPIAERVPKGGVT